MRKKIIIFLLLLLSLIIVFIVLFVPKKTLHMVIQGNEPKFNPFNIVYYQDLPFIKNIYVPFFDWDFLLTLKSPYIKRIRKVDSKNIIITLNSHFRFSNGKELTADDICYSFRISNSFKSPFGKIHRYVKSITKINKNHIKITFFKENSSLKTAFADFYIIPNHWNIKKQPPSTGPYIIINRTKHTIILKKNPFYPKKIGYKIVYLHFYPELSTIKNILSNDIILTQKHFSIPNNKYISYDIPNNNFVIWGLNLANPLNKKLSLNVRKKIFAYLDYSKINNYVEKSWNLFSNNDFYIGIYKINLIKKQAECKNDIKNINQPIYISVGIPHFLQNFFNRAIIPSLLNHNIHVKLLIFDWGTLYKKILNGDLQSFVFEVKGDDFDPFKLFNQFFFSVRDNEQGELNFFHFNNPDIDQQIKNLNSLSSYPRITIGKNLLNKVFDSFIFFPLYSKNAKLYIKKNIDMKNHFLYYDLTNYD